MVASSSLAARQWEAYLLRASAAAGRYSWISPNVLTRDRWLAELWADCDDQESLTAHQTRALWREVVDERARDLSLLETRGPAAWAQQARGLLADWCIEPSGLKAGAEQQDYAAFLDWCRHYRRRLDDNRWLDAAERLSRGLERLPSQRQTVVWLDDPELVPAHDRLLAGLKTQGWALRQRSPEARTAQCRRVGLPEARLELEAALTWAARRLGQAPAQLVAVVVPDLGSRGAEVAGLLEDCCIAHGIDGTILAGRSLKDNAFVASALDAIELLGASGSFAHLSRYLRSPFCTPGEALPERARLELQLRRELFTQLPLLTAYRLCDVDTWFEQRSPALARRLHAALEAVDFGRLEQSPTRWIASWQDGLEKLGWSALGQQVDRAAAAAWDAALASFAELTPIIGSCTAARAVSELKAILDEPHTRGPLTLNGVHVVAAIDDVGPGYAAAWVTGMTETLWPPPRQLNPLLPRRLQTLHGMPGATPADALRRADASMRRLRTRVDEAVFSWPRSMYEAPVAPSPLVQELECLELDIRRTRPRRARIEWQPDVPPRFEGTHIAGGAQTLNHQASCPVRAFCQSRLGAKSVPAWPHGVPSGLQGTTAHRALERLYDSSLSAEPGSTDAIAAAARSALDETFGRARAGLTALYELELERLSALLRALEAAEARRAPFDVAQVEIRAEIALASVTLGTRIDRIDLLASGAIAVIDYKTGRHVSRPDWFGPRLYDTQLPLYVLEQGERVGAAVVVALGSGGCRYLGYWEPSELFPGRPAQTQSWPQQRATWRTQIETLLDEYKRGDTRIFVARTELAKGDYAPLTRAAELMARHAQRGA